MTQKEQNRPTVPEVMPFATAYYRYCIECACDPEFWVTKEHYHGHDEAGELLGRLLLLMSHTQRLKIADHHDGYGDGETMDRDTFIVRARELLAKYTQK